MNTRALIEEAMRGIRVCICERCNGLGVVGLTSLQIACPECRGCGETTTNELETHSG